MADNKINVGGRLHSIATGNVLGGANEIFDDDKNKKQSDINTETYSLVNDVNERLSGLSPDQQSALSIAAKATNNETKLGYYVCGTEGNVASKVISDATGYVLSSGGSIKVKMTNANTSNNATLNINSTGAKALYYDGERASANNSWEAGETVEIYYDGTSFYANSVAGGSGSGDGAFDISAKTGDTYETLSAALTAANSILSAGKKKGGMSIKFIQLTPATYTVVKTEGVETQPTGIEVQEALSLESGTYTAAQMTGVTPPESGSVTYYFAVTVDETTTYTTWVITKATSNVHKYVQYMLTKNTWSILVRDWVKINVNDDILRIVNLTGLQAYTINGWISSEGDIHYQDNNNYKALVCEVNPTKTYLYYSGLYDASNGAIYSFYDEDWTFIEYHGISEAGWIEITPPANSKYFVANIKFASIFTQEQTNSCCFVEKTTWIKKLLSEKAENDTKFTSLFDTDSVLEQNVGLLGLINFTIDAWISNEGALNRTSWTPGTYKTLVCPVTPLKKYMYYSGVYNASFGSMYAFYDSSFTPLSYQLITQAGWIELTPPNNAVYFGACVKFANTFTEAQMRDCCFIEVTKWVEKVLEELTALDDTNERLDSFTYEESLNIFDGKTENGWLNQQGIVNPTTNAYVTTDFIPVKPNTYYRLSGRGQGATLADDALVGYEADKTTLHPVYSPNGDYPEAGTSNPYYLWNNGGIHQKNGDFKTDENTRYIRMTIRWNGSPSADWEKIMLTELGKYYDYEDTSSVPYQPYTPQTKVANEALPNSLSILKGKKIAYNGDSFCQSRLGIVANNGGAYAVLISEVTGCTFENRGKSGGILTSTQSYGDEGTRRVCLDVENMASDADLICFEGGINDWSSNIPLGDITALTNFSTFDDTTICGALESIFKQAINRWVGKPIVFIICHKIAGAANNNTLGVNFYDVHDKMVKICNKWGIPYYDAFAESTLNGDISALNNAYLTGGNAYPNPDGWHPNKEGYKRYYVPQLIKLFESLLVVNN